MLNEWKTQTDFPLSDELIKLHKLYYFLHKHKTTFSNRAPSHHMSDSNSNNEKKYYIKWMNKWLMQLLYLAMARKNIFIWK